LPQLKQQFDAIEFLIVRGFRKTQRSTLLENKAHSTSQDPPIQPTDRLLIVIDGVERLSWLQRKLIVADCRRKRVGLIVTAHRRLLGLPLLYETSFDQQRFLKILCHLGTDHYAPHYPQLKLNFGDDCRAMLFELYDRHLDREEAAQGVGTETAPAKFSRLSP